MNLRSLDTVVAELKLKSDELATIFDKTDATTDDVTRATALGNEIESLSTEKAQIENFIAQKAANEQRRVQLEAEQKKLNARPNDLPTPTVTDEPKIKSRANFKSTVFKSNEDALTAGHWFKAAYNHDQDSLRWLNDHAKKHVDNSGSQIRLKAANLTEGNEFYGGLLVPQEVGTQLVSLREEFGVFRKYADVQVMARETKVVPKVENNSAVFAVAEGGTFTQSDVSFREVALSARKFGAYLKYSSEVSDDAIINLADAITKDLAMSFEQKLDSCAFVGDGTSTYGGIVGLSQFHQWQTGINGGTWTTDATKAYNGGVVVGSSSTWASLTAADINSVIAAARRYPGFKGTMFCHQQFYAQVLQRLIDAAGGISANEMVNGYQAKYKGIDVVFVESMPSATAVSTVPLVYGDLKLGAMLGDRLGVQTDTQSTGTDFLADTITVRAKARWDVKIHDAGNYHATAASRKSGAVVCLATKNSG